MESLKKLEDIKSLKELLDVSNIEIRNYQDLFLKIAETLFNQYYIKKGDVEYNFVEIEFYLYCKDHPDIITYPRNAEAGDWFFHKSGIDICFKTKLKEGRDGDQGLIPIQEGDVYGGILIRAVNKKDKNGVITPIIGPKRFCYDLFDRFSAIDKADQYPYLEKRLGNSLNLDVKSCSRVFHFEDDNKKRELLLNEMYKKKGDKLRCECEEIDMKYKNASYRFFVPDEVEKISRYENRPKEEN